MTFGDITSPIEKIIDEARNGRMSILVDDEQRENEGDLIIPAQMATPEVVNFMAKNGRGLICLALTGERVRQLDLPLMARHNEQRNQTAFTVSIEARDGVTTGISALIGRAQLRLRSIHRARQTISRHRATSFPCWPATVVCWYVLAIQRPR